MSRTGSSSSEDAVLTDREHAFLGCLDAVYQSPSRPLWVNGVLPLDHPLAIYLTKQAADGSVVYDLEEIRSATSSRFFLKTFKRRVNRSEDLLANLIDVLSGSKEEVANLLAKELVNSFHADTFEPLLNRYSYFISSPLMVEALFEHIKVLSRTSQNNSTIVAANFFMALERRFIQIIRDVRGEPNCPVLSKNFLHVVEKAKAYYSEPYVSDSLSASFALPFAFLEDFGNRYYYFKENSDSCFFYSDQSYKKKVISDFLKERLTGGRPIDVEYQSKFLSFVYQSEQNFQGHANHLDYVNHIIPFADRYNRQVYSLASSSAAVGPSLSSSSLDLPVPVLPRAYVPPSSSRDESRALLRVLSEKVNDLQQKNSVLEGEVTRLYADFSQSQADVAEAKREYASLLSQLHNMTRNFNYSEAARVGLEGKIRELEAAQAETAARHEVQVMNLLGQIAQTPETQQKSGKRNRPQSGDSKESSASKRRRSDEFSQGSSSSGCHSAEAPSTGETAPASEGGIPSPIQIPSPDAAGVGFLFLSNEGLFGTREASPPALNIASFLPAGSPGPYGGFGAPSASPFDSGRGDGLSGSARANPLSPSSYLLGGQAARNAADGLPAREKGYADYDWLPGGD